MNIFLEYIDLKSKEIHFKKQKDDARSHVSGQGMLSMLKQVYSGFLALIGVFFIGLPFFASIATKEAFAMILIGLLCIAPFAVICYHSNKLEKRLIRVQKRRHKQLTDIQKRLISLETQVDYSKARINIDSLNTFLEKPSNRREAINKIVNSFLGFGNLKNSSLPLATRLKKAGWIQKNAELTND